MNRTLRHQYARILLCYAAISSTACSVDLTDPAPDQQLDKGLIVVYPGASSEPLEETFWLLAMRAAGIDQAVDGVVWGVPLNNFNGADQSRATTPSEAARLTQYMDDHPGRPVTL